MVRAVEMSDADDLMKATQYVWVCHADRNSSRHLAALGARAVCDSPFSLEETGCPGEGEVVRHGVLARRSVGSAGVEEHSFDRLATRDSSIALYAFVRVPFDAAEHVIQTEKTRYSDLPAALPSTERGVIVNFGCLMRR
jgi:hypothetical protein